MAGRLEPEVVEPEGEQVEGAQPLEVQGEHPVVEGLELSTANDVLLLLTCPAQVSHWLHDDQCWVPLQKATARDSTSVIATVCIPA